MVGFADFLERAAVVAADRPAVVCGETRLTHRELGARCRRLAGALAALGLRRGDRVAVVGPNCHRYLELYLAVPAAGFVLVPLNARLGTAELRRSLVDSGATVIFEGPRATVGAGDAGGLEEGTSVGHRFDLGADYEALLQAAEPIVAWPEDVSEDDLAALCYTGGTTGSAKGVMLSQRNLVANAFHFMAYWPFDTETRWIVASPMFHAAGTIGVLATVAKGGCHLVLPGFDAAGFLELVETEGGTHSLVVPTMLVSLLEELARHPRRTDSLRYLSHGSAPVAPEVLRRIHQAIPSASLLHIYGATETSPIVTMLPQEERILDRPEVRSCGQPAVGVAVRVTDPDGTVLPAGRVGEVRVKGPNVTAGYHGRPEETRAALVDGWYRTGDLGSFDDHGYLYLVDRVKDMIVTGGENVYSVEVEQALYRHPAVREAAVFGVPDAHWGEAVHAIVVADGPIRVEDLLAHCRAELAAYQVPKHIDVRSDPLPKSGAGKILKRVLREPFWAGHERRIAGAGEEPARPRPTEPARRNDAEPATGGLP